MYEDALSSSLNFENVAMQIAKFPVFQENEILNDIQDVLASLQSNGSTAAATQEFTALNDKWEGIVEDFSEQPGNPPTFGVQYKQIFGTYEPPPPPPQIELEWWTWLLVALLVPLAIASAVLLV